MSYSEFRGFCKKIEGMNHDLMYDDWILLAHCVIFFILDYPKNGSVTFMGYNLDCYISGQITTDSKTKLVFSTRSGLK
jgi:hypothetical protein